MKELLNKIVITFIISVLLVVTLAGTAFAAEDGNGYMMPAPESGDGIPNGSGFDGEVGDGPGPAPNSGDGVSDGSGF